MVGYIDVLEELLYIHLKDNRSTTRLKEWSDDMIAYITNRPEKGFIVNPKESYFGSFIPVSRSEHREPNRGPITIVRSAIGDISGLEWPWYEVESKLISLEEALEITDRWRNEGFPHSREESKLRLLQLM